LLTQAAELFASPHIRNQERWEQRIPGRALLVLRAGLAVLLRAGGNICYADTP
jgi:hypothetical protein